MPLLGLSLRFSYNHLLFSPTLAFPVAGVGVPGALLPLSLNKLLSNGLPPPKLARLFALLLRPGEYPVPLALRIRLCASPGLPEPSSGRSPVVLKLLRGVERL
jgi:hypothetical protein